MDKEDIKNIGQKVYKGCGCMSIGIVVSIIILCIIGSFIDDEEPEESAKVEQTAAKDSLVVNEPLEGDPYQELDELIGLENVKQEVRTLANFVKLQKQREA